MPPPLRSAARFDIAYRPIGEEDLPFLRALYGSTRAEEVASTGWPPEIQERFLDQQFDAQHRHYMAHYPDAEWLVVERAGAPIGRLYIEEWAREIRIIDIALVPASTGGGIGSAVLCDMMEVARAAGKALSAHVEKHNPAMRLYRRLGFATVEEGPVYDRIEWRPDAAPA